MDTEIIKNYSIRDYKSSDYKNIVNLWTELGLANPKRGDTRETIEKTLQLGGKFLILETTTGELIGTSWISNDGRRLYLHHFGIKKQYQGKGLSKILLNASLDFARQMNMQIKLEVHQKNIVAKNLYRKAGFEYLGDYEVWIIRKPKEIQEL